MHAIVLLAGSVRVRHSVAVNCRKSVSRDQDALIPSANMRHLMLRDDVVKDETSRFLAKSVNELVADGAREGP